MQGVFSPEIPTKAGALTPRDVFDDLQTPRLAPLGAESASNVDAAAGMAAKLAAQAQDGIESRSGFDGIKALRSGHADSLGDSSMGQTFEAAMHSEQDGAFSSPLASGDGARDVFATPRPGAAAPFASPQVRGSGEQGWKVCWGRCFLGLGCACGHVISARSHAELQPCCVAVPAVQEHASLSHQVGGGMAANPMTAASDAFDGLFTPAVAATGGAAAGAAAATALAKAQGAAVPPGSAPPSGSASGMDAEDVFDFLQTPAPGSPADGAGLADAARSSAAKADGDEGGAEQREVEAPGGALAGTRATAEPAGLAAGRRPGFHLDINQLANCSESGKPGLRCGLGAMPNWMVWALGLGGGMSLALQLLSWLLASAWNQPTACAFLVRTAPLQITFLQLWKAQAAQTAPSPFPSRQACAPRAPRAHRRPLQLQPSARRPPWARWGPPQPLAPPPPL